MCQCPLHKTEPAQNTRQHVAEGDSEVLKFGAKINLTACGACTVVGDSGVYESEEDITTSNKASS